MPLTEEDEANNKDDAIEEDDNQDNDESMKGSHQGEWSLINN
jgi:hypothetical protein